METGLFEEVALVTVEVEIANSLGTDDIAGQLGADEVVEFVEVESRAAIVNECADAVFFNFSAFVVMMVSFMMVLMFFFVVVPL